MLSIDLVIQQVPSVQTMTADRAFICSALTCCAGVAQSSHSHVMLAGRSVKCRHRRSKERIGGIGTGALEVIASGRLEAALHTGRVSFGQASRMQPGGRISLLWANEEAEWRRNVRSPSG